MSLLVLALLFLGAISVCFLLLGALTRGSGADLVDWDPSARAERDARWEREDFEELLELDNRYRRERALSELAEEDGLEP